MEQIGAVDGAHESGRWISCSSTSPKYTRRLGKNGTGVTPEPIPTMGGRAGLHRHGSGLRSGQISGVGWGEDGFVHVGWDSILHRSLVDCPALEQAYQSCFRCRSNVALAWLDEEPMSPAAPTPSGSRSGLLASAAQ